MKNKIEIDALANVCHPLFSPFASFAPFRG